MYTYIALERRYHSVTVYWPSDEFSFLEVFLQIFYQKLIFLPIRKNINIWQFVFTFWTILSEMTELKISKMVFNISVRFVKNTEFFLLWVLSILSIWAVSLKYQKLK